MKLNKVTNLFNRWRITVLVVCCTGTALASTVNILPNVNGSTQVVNSIVNTVATGTTMGGIMVTANYLDTGNNATSSETLTWTAIGGNAGPGVTGTNFSLTEVADTGLGTSGWTLESFTSNIAITSIILNGFPANVVFDRSTDNITSPSSGHVIGVGTPGSDTGGDYLELSENKGHPPYTVNVTYSNIVGLLGSPACQGSATTPNGPNAGTCGDLFSTLTFAFDSAGGGFYNAHPGNGNDAIWTFFQDTDITGAGVPEPMTLGLLGAGLLAIAGYGLARRQLP